jgi:hypothetical protein
MAKSIASTLSSVFGGELPFTHQGGAVGDVPVVIRRDIEVIDESGQVIGRTNTVRIAHADIAFVPARGDYVDDGAVRYTLGKRLADNKYSYLFEATT